MLDVITRRSNLELMLQIGAEILVSEDPRHRGDHPESLSSAGSPEPLPGFARDPDGQPSQRDPRRANGAAE